MSTRNSVLISQGSIGKPEISSILHIHLKMKRWTIKFMLPIPCTFSSEKVSRYQTGSKFFFLWHRLLYSVMLWLIREPNKARLLLVVFHLKLCLFWMLISVFSHIIYVFLYHDVLQLCICPHFKVIFILSLKQSLL